MKNTTLSSSSARQVVNKENKLEAGSHLISYLTTCYQLITHLWNACTREIIQKPVSLKWRGADKQDVSSGQHLTISSQEDGKAFSLEWLVLKVPSISEPASRVAVPVIHSRQIKICGGHPGRLNLQWPLMTPPSVLSLWLIPCRLSLCAGPNPKGFRRQGWAPLPWETLEQPPCVFLFSLLLLFDLQYASFHLH